ncbi:MAG: DNA polymerase III subunit epsilon [Rhodospirillaceae bacterium]
MREIVLDTETTGFKPEDGHRVVEIGCVELFNHLPTGQTRQWYLNPEREVPEDAVRVHGLTTAFLADKPLFRDIAGGFLDFIADAPLIAHNAAFDIAFLDAELQRLDPVRRPLPLATNRQIIDTVQLARQKFPGAGASLDALCKRFGIDNSGRSLHGALLDSTLLAEVYLELLGGRQTGFALAAPGAALRSAARAARTARPPRPHAPSPEELEAHAALLKKLKGPLWVLP